jgi:hypothetical protein
MVRSFFIAANLAQDRPAKIAEVDDEIEKLWEETVSVLYSVNQDVANNKVRQLKSQ